MTIYQYIIKVDVSLYSKEEINTIKNIIKIILHSVLEKPIEGRVLNEIIENNINVIIQVPELYNVELSSIAKNIIREILTIKGYDLIITKLADKIINN